MVAETLEYDRFESVTLTRFRGFAKPTRIPLAPLTFLVGPNSGGKSSIFDALMFLGQSQLTAFNRPPVRPRWGGPLVDLGSYEDAVWQHDSRLTMHLGVVVSSPLLRAGTRVSSGSCQAEIEFSFKTREGDPIGGLTRLRITDCLSGTAVRIEPLRSGAKVTFLGQELRVDWSEGPGKEYAYYSPWHTSRLARQLMEAALRRAGSAARGKKAACSRLVAALDFPFWQVMEEMQRVSSGRAAPRRWYPLEDIRPLGRSFGTPDGRVFDEVTPETTIEPRSTASDFGYYPAIRTQAPSFTLQSALADLDIATSVTRSRLSAYHRQIQVKDSSTGITSNLIDVGYGASQVIPVLRACLSPARGPLFIEQPEIHLHPRAQGVLASLLAETSRLRQVIVETHSVHLIDRARILVAEGKLDPAHVLVVFVARDSHGSHATPIRVGMQGDFLDAWPPDFGFFDERYKDSVQLLRLKRPDA